MVVRAWWCVHGGDIKKFISAILGFMIYYAIFQEHR